MPYNFVSDSFHTKKLCSMQTFFKQNAILHRKRPFCVFELPFHHLRLILKRISEFLLALIELFFARCYGWGATSEYRFKIGDFAPTKAGWSKISPRWGHPHQPFFLSDKKLIRRWDSERELSLRRYRARTTKYNRLVHKFRHRSTRLCVGTHAYQIQWNNAI